MIHHQQHVRFVAKAVNKVYGQARLTTTALGNKTSITAINVMVKRQGTAIATLDTTLTPIATYITDSLVTTDPGYSCDTNDARTLRGYNFSWAIPASAFPSEGWYTVEARFTDAGGDTRLLWYGPAFGTIDA